jgi:hypothetical protein
MADIVINGNPANIDASSNEAKPMDKTAKRIEQRYIELLEEKIALLESELKSYKDGKKVPSGDETLVSPITFPNFFLSLNIG